MMEEWSNVELNLSSEFKGSLIAGQTRYVETQWGGCDITEYQGWEFDESWYIQAAVDFQFSGDFMSRAIMLDCAW